MFLLVGYSSTDESLLRPHTNLGVQDAVRALQHYMVQHINNQVSGSFRFITSSVAIAYYATRPIQRRGNFLLEFGLCVVGRRIKNGLAALECVEQKRR